VFLRVLEYYNGILFLTTNRPGALDEAFKSRIHLKLYYPPLTGSQTHDIWQVNIERLRLIEEQRCEGNLNEQPLQIYEQEIMAFAQKQFQSQEGRGRWNGRQIRNAFQIAASLALFDSRKQLNQLRERDPDVAPLRPKLDVKHFSMIHHITTEFDIYMEETVGKNDAEQAFEAGERSDHFDPRLFRSREDEVGSYGIPASSGGSGRGWGRYDAGGGGWKDGQMSSRKFSFGPPQPSLHSTAMGGYDDAGSGSPNMKAGFAFGMSPDQRPLTKGWPSAFPTGGNGMPHGGNSDRNYGGHGGPASSQGQSGSGGREFTSPTELQSGPMTQATGFGYGRGNGYDPSYGP
jgi:hypothetical protein